MTLSPLLSKYIRHPVLLLVVRLVVGGVFAVFGVVKLIEPHEEFFSVIAGYNVLPAQIVPIFGTVLIFLEIVVGLAFIIGLYVRWSAAAIAGLLAMFLVALVQTVARGIPLEDCGCTGSLINLGESVTTVIWRDVLMLAAVIWFLIVRSNAWTIDQLMDRRHPHSPTADK